MTTLMNTIYLFSFTLIFSFVISFILYVTIECPFRDLFRMITHI